ncbi:hypothetical protein OAO01_05990 [Oligoflexia bacterium]|nr:hypothetical protein [Oligoflexia bacterium]
MSVQLNDDLEASHLILNYLNAGYQGKFAFYNILSQLNYSSFNPESVTSTREALNQVNMWLNSLWRGNAIVCASWTTTEDYKSRKAVQMLEELKEDLKLVAWDVCQIFARENLSKEPESVKLLIAALGRYVYSRDNYIRGFIEFSKVFNSPDIAEQFTPLLPDVQEDVDMVHDLLAAYRKSTEQKGSFYHSLLDLVVTLPGTFYTHIHDINQIMSPLKGGFSFELTEIQPEEVALWKSFNVEPVEAGYWHAFGMNPEEAVAWNRKGFLEPLYVARWKVYGFGPEEARLWYDADFPIDIASLWSQAGFTPEEALANIDRGFVHPTEVPHEKEEEEDSDSF